MNYIKILVGMLVLLNSNFSALADTNTTTSPRTIQSFHLQKIFFTHSLRQEFSKFVDNILRQIPSQQLFDFIDKTMKKTEHPYSAKDFYSHLINKAKHITPTIGFYHKFKALQKQKKVLCCQIRQLIGAKKIENIVEIGTPATYTSGIKEHIAITGNVYAVYDKKRASDSAQSFSFNPLKKFVAKEPLYNCFNNEYTLLTRSLSSNFAANIYFHSESPPSLTFTDSFENYLNAYIFSL